MKALLISIHPEYVKKILQGTKVYEFRKKLAKDNVDYMIIYATAPQMKVVASAKIEERLCFVPQVMWKKTYNMAGVTSDEFFKYFNNCEVACAYKLSEVFIFDKAMDLSYFGIKNPPQSFAYINLPASFQISSDTVRK